MFGGFGVVPFFLPCLLAKCGQLVCFLCTPGNQQKHHDSTEQRQKHEETKQTMVTI